MTHADYQSSVFVKVSESEILEMTYENYLRTYWSDYGSLTQEIKEVEPDDIEGDVIYRVVTRYRSTNKIHSTDDFWTREEAKLMILRGLEVDQQNANNDIPMAFFSREEIAQSSVKVSAIENWKVQDRETGTIIDIFDSEEKAKKAVKDYEETDKKEGNYTPDFYEIVKY